jgi:DNA-directed RNA polymerase subunit RPC12/RpoP
MPFSDCQPGKWYIVATCHSCGMRQPLFPDPSKGKEELDSTIAQCPLCGGRSFYKATELEHYRHSSGDLIKTKDNSANLQK